MIADYFRANPDDFMILAGVILTFTSFWGMRNGLDFYVGSKLMPIGVVLVAMGLVVKFYS